MLLTAYGAGIWDLTEAPSAVPLTAVDMLPGAHVVAVIRPEHADIGGIALRRAMFEVRDSIVWQRPGEHLLVTLARAPLDGTTAHNVIMHGVGGLNIDACRVLIGDADREASEAKNAHTQFQSGPPGRKVFGKDKRDVEDWSGGSGRFPTNLLLQHDKSCVPVGVAMTQGDKRGASSVKGSRPGGFGNVGAAKGAGGPNANLYPPAEVTVFDCTPACPVGQLDLMSGDRRAGVFPPARGKSVSSDLGYSGETVGGYRIIGDVGGASRYFPRFTEDAQVWEWLERLVTPDGVSVKWLKAAPAPM